MFLAIAVDNLANAQELTAAETEQVVDNKEKQQQELEREIETLQGSDGSLHAEMEPLARSGGENKSKGDEKKEEEVTDGPKPMLPYSCMFILSPTNP